MNSGDFRSTAYCDNTPNSPTAAVDAIRRDIIAAKHRTFNI
jgi:hypothetical protein